MLSNHTEKERVLIKWLSVKYNSRRNIKVKLMYRMSNIEVNAINLLALENIFDKFCQEN